MNLQLGARLDMVFIGSFGTSKEWNNKQKIGSSIQAS